MNEIQKEIIQIAIEECAEVIQCLTKITRFGVEDSHPNNPLYTNKDHLNEEIGDLMTMVELLHKVGMVNMEDVEYAAGAKKEKLKRWTKHIKEIL